MNQLPTIDCLKKQMSNIVSLDVMTWSAFENPGCLLYGADNISAFWLNFFHSYFLVGKAAIHVRDKNFE